MPSRASQRLIDVARIGAMIACVGLLYSPSVGTIGLIATYVAFVLSGQAVARVRGILTRPLVYWGVAFLGVVLLGMLYAAVPWPDRWMDFYKWRTMVWLFVVLAIFDDLRWKERFLYVFIGGTGVAVVISLISGFFDLTVWRGAHELLRNSGTQGMAFACGALICVWLFRENLQGRSLSWLWPSLAALYCLNIIFITHSRSGYAVLGCGLALLLSWKGSPRQRGLVVLGLCLATGLSYLVSPRMQGIVDAGIEQWRTAEQSEQLTNFGSRRVFYQNSIEVLERHWVVGVGTGGFTQAYADHVSNKYDASDWRALHTTDPHNQYLSIAIQQGLLGVTVFLVWLVVLMRERESRRDYHQLAVAILVGWCVTSLFSSHFRTFAEGHVLATFLGVLLAVEVPLVAPRPDIGLSQEV